MALRLSNSLPPSYSYFGGRAFGYARITIFEKTKILLIRSENGLTLNFSDSTALINTLHRSSRVWSVRSFLIVQSYQNLPLEYVYLKIFLSGLNPTFHQSRHQREIYRLTVFRFALSTIFSSTITFESNSIIA